MNNEYPTPHDWESIKLRYITTPKLPYLTVFAKQEGVDYGLLRNYKSQQNWGEERKEYQAQLFAEKKQKAILTSIEQYQTASEETVALALLLQEIVRLKLAQIKDELSQPPSYGEDEEEEGGKTFPVRSSDILNYANSLKAITEVLKSNNDFASGLSILVSTGIVTKKHATNIQTAIAAGDTATRLALAEAFSEEIIDSEE